MVTVMIIDWVFGISAEFKVLGMITPSCYLSKQALLLSQFAVLLRLQFEPNQMAYLFHLFDLHVPLSSSLSSLITLSCIPGIVTIATKLKVALYSFQATQYRNSVSSFDFQGGNFASTIASRVDLELRSRTL